MTQTQTKTYSITEMARTCGVSVSSMRSQLLKRGLKPAQTGENNSKLYDAAVLDTMKKYYRSKSKRGSNRPPQTTRSELIESKNTQIEQLQAEIELLKSQLDVKDEQIKAMTEVAQANAQLTAQAHTLDASHRLEDSTTNDTKPTQDVHGRFWHWLHD
ncbi:hypothetical protein [Limosilactobacillus coleohominis]|uniref:hypothetical protein n=1 Tax=Limosilactobacillus coleohominis TaxID=181675 RepID=UPI002A911203|nr:hypothetical protein [Limosilactobacillus coleohominis]MDY5629322.1 hypothetical protein [Limosilactobacillus coleohominis]